MCDQNTDRSNLREEKVFPYGSRDLQPLAAGKHSERLSPWWQEHTAMGMYSRGCSLGGEPGSREWSKDQGAELAFKGLPPARPIPYGSTASPAGGRHCVNTVTSTPASFLMGTGYRAHKCWSLACESCGTSCPIVGQSVGQGGGYSWVL